jgi:hypothetical protein
LGSKVTLKSLGPIATTGFPPAGPCHCHPGVTKPLSAQPLHSCLSDLGPGVWGQSLRTKVSDLSCPASHVISPVPLQPASSPYNPGMLHALHPILWQTQPSSPPLPALFSGSTSFQMTMKHPDKPDASP